MIALTDPVADPVAERLRVPADEAALAEAIAGANGPLRVVGGETRGVVTDGTLSTALMTGVTLYEPGAMTIAARAGTPLAEIEDCLASEGQILAFEPMDHRPVTGATGTPTIGGAVATNASGPRRLRAGACRDSLIGVRFVDGTGRVVLNGGRVMKNVTGYDLCKLMAGSHGTLGVLTEVTFKVLPKPQATITLRYDAMPATRAVALMSAALRTPFEVTGAARLPDGSTRLRIEGFENGLADRAARLAAALSRGFGEPQHLTDPEEQTALWRSVRDAVPMAPRAGDLWRVSLRPSQAPALLARLGNPACLMDWGGGLLWIPWDPGGDLRAELGAIDGHATRIRGTGPLPRFHPEAAPVARLSSDLRAAFDPRGILNPGLMG